MFYDHSKLTMATVEMKTGLDIALFEQQQHAMVNDLNALINTHQLADQLKVDPTAIATDIENNHSGKDLGAQRMLEIMFQNQSQSCPKYSYQCFGDSKSDIDMATHLHKQGLQVKFIYVGKTSMISQLTDLSAPFPIDYPTTLFDNGTLDYINSHFAQS